MRARCDAFDAETIRNKIKCGDTTPLLAYRDYASTAARPYARSTWQMLLKSPKTAAPGLQQIGEPWTELTPVKPVNVLTTITDRANLKVRGGALYVTDGERILVYEPRGAKPFAIVMTGWAGFVTIEAMRFCSDYSVAIIVLDWTRDFMYDRRSATSTAIRRINKGASER